MKNHLVFLGSAVCILSTSIAAQQPQEVMANCHAIDGVFKRSSDKLVMTIIQNGCKISGLVPSEHYDHSIKGIWVDRQEGGFYKVKISRTNKTNGCTTIMNGKLWGVGGDIRLQITGTEGHCDLPAGFSEDTIYKFVI